MKITEKSQVIYVKSFGQLRLESNGIIIDDKNTRSIKMWSVLAYLIINRDRAIPTSELIDMFWDEDESKNPTSALKTLFHRMRTLLVPLLGEDINPFLSSNGTYQWNNQIIVNSEAEQFSQILENFDNDDKTERGVFALKNALDLYKGEFLPRLNREIWIAPLATFYRELFIKGILKYVQLLNKKGDYSTALKALSRGISADPYNEEFHVLLIKSQLHLGQNNEALEHYRVAAELLREYYMAPLSNEFLQLYPLILADKTDSDINIEDILAETSENNEIYGAFTCDFSFFKKICKLRARKAIRTKANDQLCLIKIIKKTSGEIDPLVLSESMTTLTDCLLSNLRNGDVVSKYSGSQQLILLGDLNSDDTNSVMNRISKAFTNDNSYDFIDLDISVSQL